MINIAVMLQWKLNFFSSKRHFRHVPIQDDDLGRIEGRRGNSDSLKTTAQAPDSITTKSKSCKRANLAQHTNNDKRITGAYDRRKQTSNYLQRQEDERFHEFENKSKSVESEWQIKVKRLKFLKRKIELARRKRVESQGSFASNMVTYKDDKNKSGLEKKTKGNGEREHKSRRSSKSSTSGDGKDDRSLSSNSTCRTNDVTLHVIDEEIKYHYT